MQWTVIVGALESILRSKSTEPIPIGGLAAQIGTAGRSAALPAVCPTAKQSFQTGQRAIHGCREVAFAVFQAPANRDTGQV